jgi:hypothetical protein
MKAAPGRTLFAARRLLQHDIQKADIAHSGPHFRKVPKGDIGLNAKRMF